MRIFSLILSFSLIFCVDLTAQQNRFLYIQTENSQPFYVRVNNVVYSSSNSGYVIIPKLKDGRYDLTVGFPKNEWPLQNVSVTIDSRDAGYMLKNFGEKGWGLFNLQSLDVTMANAGPGKTQGQVPEDDSFAGTLSQVVGADLSTPVAVVDKSAPAIVKKEEPVKEVKEVKEETEPAMTVVPKEAASQPGSIQKLLSTSSDEGIDIVYLDNSGNTSDTIRIFIPAPRKEADVKEKQPVSEPVAAKKDPVIGKAADPAKKKGKDKEKTKEPEFIEMDLATDSVAKQTEVSVQQESQPPSITIPNSNCRSNADDRDFLKLRKNMAGKRSAESMVDAARKDFRSRCYSVEQVKHLSALFLDDAGKYMFFDAAYPSVHDFSNFPSLVSELKDPYYITRFEAMIRK